MRGVTRLLLLDACWLLVPGVKNEQRKEKRNTQTLLVMTRSARLGARERETQRSRREKEDPEDPGISAKGRAVRSHKQRREKRREKSEGKCCKPPPLLFIRSPASTAERLLSLSLSRPPPSLSPLLSLPSSLFPAAPVALPNFPVGRSTPRFVLLAHSLTHRGPLVQELKRHLSIRDSQSGEMLLGTRASEAEAALTRDCRCRRCCCSGSEDLPQKQSSLSSREHCRDADGHSLSASLLRRRCTSAHAPNQAKSSLSRL